VYTITAVLFSIPLCILIIAWRVSLENQGIRDWRARFLSLSLVTSTLAILSGFAFWLSWTHSGGSPHGLIPPLGIWLPLRETAKWSVVATVAVAIFARGKGRFWVIGSVVSMCAVLFFLTVLEMD
jgi:hypothetical protein